MYGSAIALADGRLAEAEAAAARSYEWSRLLTGRDASGGYGIQMFGLRREQGRLPELAPAVRALAGRGPFGDQAWRPARAALFAELGMEQECRAELEQVRAAGLDALRDTSPWLASLTYLTDAAVAVEDRELAALLYTELLPHAGTNVMIGIGVASYGSADRYLGMLAAVLGDVIVAERHLDDAMALNERMGATTWMAHTAYQYARLLLVGEGRAASRGAAWLREASALASRAGLPALLARIRALEGPVRADVVLPDGLSAREVEILVLVARGLSNREIGAELVISEHTAASHVRSILRKTRCANRTEAASYAHTNGLAASLRAP
jgi:DNA-binding CsgD family transcriptional regulator